MQPVAPVWTSLEGRLKLLQTKRLGLAIALWGEPGIGKTWTAQQLLQRLTCRSLTLHAALPLNDVAKVLPKVAKLPVWAARVLERLERAEYLEASAVADALAALFAKLAPVLLHLEDLHEVPSEHVVLWQALATRLSRTRGTGIIITSRTRPPEGFEAYRVEPLEAASVRMLLEQEVGAPLPQEASSWIYGRAEGNPLYTLEYFRYLTKQGFLWNDGQRWHWRPPPQDLLPITVEALIERLLQDACPTASTKDALEAKTILPINAVDSLWIKVANLAPDVLQSASHELERHGVFSLGNFAHPLYREVALRMLPRERHQIFAKRALDALQDDPEAAAEFIDGAGLAPAATRDVLLRAAEAARAAGNDVQAARFLARAVDDEVGESRGQLAFDAAKGLQSADIHESIRLARIAVNEAGDPEARYFLAGQLTVLGRSAEAEEVLSRLPESLRSGAAWAERLIHVRGGAGDAASVVALWREHPELHTTPKASVAYGVGFSLIVLGEPQEADALAARALKTASSSLDRCRLLIVRGLARTNLMDYPQAETFFNDAVALARGQNLASWIAVALHNRAILLEEVGRYQEMLLDVEEALRLYGEFGDSRRYASTQTKLARHLLERGDYERAEDLLLDCRELLSRSDPSPFLVTCECSLSDLYRHWQPPHARILALKHAQTALALARELNIPAKIMQALVATARAQACQGDAAQALLLANEALELARQSNNSENILFSLWARADALTGLGRREGALDDLEEANHLAKEQGNEFGIHQVGLDLDRLRDDVVQARERLAWFEARGFLDDANRVHRYFPELSQAEPAAERVTPEPLLRLEVLGPMRVSQNGLVKPIRGRRRQELLARLLEARIAGRVELSQLELLDALYPNDSEEAAATALKQLVFQIRSSLGPGVIARTGSGYALAAVTSDVEAFLTTGDTSLWRGIVLENVGSVNEGVAGALYQALRSKIEGFVTESPQEAVRLGRLLLQADPYDVEALRLTVRALQEIGNQREIEKFYEVGRKHFAEVGETLPSQWTDFLAPPAA